MGGGNPSKKYWRNYGTNQAIILKWSKRRAFRAEVFEVLHQGPHTQTVTLLGVILEGTAEKTQICNKSY